MKAVWRAGILSAAIVIAAGSTRASAAPGDFWSLSGDMQTVSNPSPPIDPGAPGGGAGTWTYLQGGSPFPASTTDLATDVNGEVPDQGIGWYVPGSNHLMLAKFSVDFNAAPPHGTGNDKTNFVIGDVGGHATTGAQWTTDHAGVFRVEWLGYNARNQGTASPNETGRATTLRMTAPSGDLDVVSIVGGGGFDGSANAYTKSAVLNLLGGQSITLMQEGGDWSGLDLRVTEVPEPAASWLIIVGIGWGAGSVRRRRGKQEI